MVDKPNSDGTISSDPFSAEEAPGVQLIVQMRIYDALMALLTEIAPDKARDLMNLHAQGILMANSPRVNGQFIADLMDDTKDDEG